MEKLDLLELEDFQGGNNQRKCLLAGFALVAGGGLAALTASWAIAAGTMWGGVSYSDCF